MHVIIYMPITFWFVDGQEFFKKHHQAILSQRQFINKMLPVLGAAAAFKVVQIICRTITEDRNDARSQRYRLTLKRQVKEPDGTITEDEVIMEFETEEKMAKHAKALSDQFNAPVKYLKN